MIRFMAEPPFRWLLFLGGPMNVSAAGTNVMVSAMANPTPMAVNTPNSVTAVNDEPMKERNPIRVVIPVNTIGTPTSPNAR